MARNPAWSENTLFQDYWDDGLLDLLAGLALLLAGLGWQTRLGILAIIQAPLWIVLWRPLRQSLVEPHAGYVEFCLARRRTITRNMSAAVVLGLAVLALVVLLQAWPGTVRLDAVRPEWSAAIPASIVGVMGIMTALLTGARRFFAYSGVSLLAAAAAGALAWHPGDALAITGAALAAGGAVLLTRFLRESRSFDGTK